MPASNCIVAPARLIIWLVASTGPILVGLWIFGVDLGSPVETLLTSWILLGAVGAGLDEVEVTAKAAAGDGAKAAAELIDWRDALRVQLEGMLKDAMFAPIEWSEALYVPPFSRDIRSCRD